jgi:hypothetical protein
MIKFIFRVFVVLILLVVVYGVVAYVKGQSGRWETKIEKAEVLLTSIQKMIVGIEGPLPELKRNIDLLKSANTSNSALAMYEEFYTASLALIDVMKENEKLAQELLEAARNKDTQKVKALYAQLERGMEEMNGFVAKHKVLSEEVKSLRK